MKQPETLSIFVCETFEVNKAPKVSRPRREKKLVAIESPYVKDLFQLVACLIARPPTGVSLRSDSTTTLTLDMRM